MSIILVVITGTINLLLYLLSKVGHCNSFDDREPIDEICRCLIFQWVVALYGLNYT